MVTHPDIVQNTLHALIIEVHTYLKKKWERKKKTTRKQQIRQFAKIEIFFNKDSHNISCSNYFRGNLSETPSLSGYMGIWELNLLPVSQPCGIALNAPPSSQSLQAIRNVECEQYLDRLSLDLTWVILINIL